MTPNDVPDLCNRLNGENTCAATACIVEQTFVKKQQAWSLTQIADIPKYSQVSGTFDVDASCPITTGVPSEKKCCGANADRFPFRTQDGQGIETRDCCAGSLFNSQIYQCCGGETVNLDC